VGFGWGIQTDKNWLGDLIKLKKTEVELFENLGTFFKEDVTQPVSALSRGGGT
jgi:hypothetical protein